MDFLRSGLRPSLRKSTVFYHKVTAILILFQLAIAICDYYHFRYFSPSLDPFMENTLFDINAKLNNTNKFNKSQWINGIKNKRKNDLPHSNKV